MEFDLKWIHMARYELILRLDGALWLTIISEAPLTPKRAMEGTKIPKESKMALRIRGALRLLSPPESQVLILDMRSRYCGYLSVACSHV